MRLTIDITAPAQADSQILTLDFLADTTVGSLKETVQAQSRIPKNSQHIYHNGILLADESKTMQELHIGDNEMLALHVRDMSARRAPTASRQHSARQQQAAQQQQRGGAQTDPETLRLQILGDPASYENLSRLHPDLAAVLNDPAAFAQLVHRRHEEDRQEQARAAAEIARLNDDPFDPVAQAQIAELIRKQAVQDNLTAAMEYNPEVFGRVHMLYIDVEVNGHKVKAFVDSGAQATIMSPSCAEACNIMRLADTRFKGVARGVGTAAILGRVSLAQIKIGTMHFPCSFTVMEGKDVDLLLGLDMLKRHQACIDLARDVLVIQGMEIPFLGEADIPKEMEEERAAEPQIAGPGGTTIGGRSGVVSAPTASSAPAAPQPLAQQPAAAPARPSFPAEDIDQLVSLGFSRDEVIQALTACDGNVEYAGGLLLG